MQCCCIIPYCFCAIMLPANAVKEGVLFRWMASSSKNMFSTLTSLVNFVICGETLHFFDIYVYGYTAVKCGH